MIKMHTNMPGNDFIRENYLTMTDIEMGLKLDLSKAAIEKRRYFLDLKRKRPERVSKNLMAYIMMLFASGLNLKDVSRRTKVGYNAVNWVIDRHYMRKKEGFVITLQSKINGN